MIVRRAEEKDAEVIAQINVQTWQCAYKGIVADSVLEARKADEKRIATWAGIIQSNERVVLVCEYDGAVAGYLAAGPARDDYGAENEIYALYVKPDFQQKGIGSALIKKYKEVIQNQNFYLYMLKKNERAAGFYLKNGGKVCEEFARHMTIGEQELEEVCYFFKK